jgi:probable F420-dependent oxidoreductase
MFSEAHIGKVPILQTPDCCMTDLKQDQAQSLREKLGLVGVRSRAVVSSGGGEARNMSEEIEELGYRAIWYPETMEALTQGALLLAWTRELAVCSSIAGIYARDPVAMARGSTVLNSSFGDRFVLGLGVSHRTLVEHRGHEYQKPLTAMSAYLRAMDKADQTAPLSGTSTPRLLAALSPGMLRLAREFTMGAHPFFVPVEHTYFAREALGSTPLLCVEQAVILTEDRSEALRIAMEYLEIHLKFPNYRNCWRRLGFEEAEISPLGLFEKVIAWGSVADIQQRVRAHLEAGADHVCVQALVGKETELDCLREIAPALTAIEVRS